MQEKFLSTVLLLMLVAVGKTASADPTGYLSWPLLAEKLASINFYKQCYVYIQALWQEGIPGLSVPPLDPFHTDAQFTILQAHNPNYPMFTNMEIKVNGLNVSHFSNIDILIAELDAEAMKTNLSLYQDYAIFANNDVRATAVYTDGRLLSCNCTSVHGSLGETTYDSIKQLEVVGTVLHVKQFNFVLKSNAGSLYGPYDCIGNEELVDYMSDLLFETLFDFLPNSLNAMAANITEVLNDIFALRNITYEIESMSADHSSSHQVHQLSEVDGNWIPDKMISRSRTRAEYENSAEVFKENPLTITWANN